MTREVNLLRASGLVGGIGAAFSAPLVLTLALYTRGRPHAWLFFISPGVLTFRSFSFGQFGLFPYLVSLVVLGWIPILGGIYAGTKAARFLGAD